MFLTLFRVAFFQCLLHIIFPRSALLVPMLPASASAPTASRQRGTLYFRSPGSSGVSQCPWLRRHDVVSGALPILAQSDMMAAISFVSNHSTCNKPRVKFVNLQSQIPMQCETFHHQSPYLPSQLFLPSTYTLAETVWIRIDQQPGHLTDRFCRGVHQTGSERGHF